jgi:UDP-N-acetylglucosamine--N-acetylmuramyl-(pentapeptide) pyrophosphoryl-undecaprenol N-acetylglucosamine transferase
MGGSLAARTINAAALALAPWLAEVGWRVIHLAGQEEAAQAREVYQQAGVQAEVMGFCHDMPRVYAEADIVLGRAGASSCAELALAGLGSVLVPLPIAAEDHQTVNAQALAQRGAAVVVPQDSDDGSLSERLQKNFSYLAADPKRIHTMGAAALGLARPQAAAAAWQLIDTLIGRPGGKP